MSNGSLPTDAPAVRLCSILKWEDFDGYGFNLHAEKGKPGQYIGKVDEGSPAEAAGLKQGDRIVEVNGVNISNENHKQVVQRIKAVPDETKLLVVDAEADSYYKSKSIIIKSTLPNVIQLKSPERSKAHDNHEDADRDSVDTRSQKSERSSAFAENEQTNGDKTSYKGSSGTTTPSSERKHSLASSPEPHNNEMPSPKQDGPNNGSFNPSLNLNMTAAELRAQLAARKKFDPKKENIDLKRKFDIIQTL